MYSRPTNTTLAALTMASAASIDPTRPFVSIIPSASMPASMVFLREEVISPQRHPEHKGKRPAGRKRVCKGKLMAKPKKILVALKTPQQAVELTDLACRVAARGASIILVHVVE